jgi:nicotinate dehydrogenase subunit A
MAQISLKVNGMTRVVDADPTTPLLYVLRNDLDQHGPPFRLRSGPVRRLHRDR